MAGTDPRVASIPVPVWAAVIGATSVVIGIVWDISWHRSIGRDTFWSPPHMAIYAGAALAGLAAAVLVLRATSAGRGEGVRIGPLRGPLGAWVIAWGAVAMLASAPFDDWWHAAYGLDVQVISPPHTVLAIGMVVVALGAMLLALSLQNGAGPSRVRAPGVLYLYAAGALVTLVAIFIIEYTFPQQQHGWLFYAISGGVFPAFLVAIGVAGRVPRGATIAALSYMLIIALMGWVLPLFPAEPRLAPIYNPITRMAPLCFPLLLVFPAIAIDGILKRRDRGRENRTAILLGAAFLGVFIAVQYPFASFQMTPPARNWLFLGDRYWSYYFHPDAVWRYGFFPGARDRPSAAGFLLALVLAIASARAGLAAGRGFTRVRR